MTCGTPEVAICLLRTSCYPTLFTWNSCHEEFQRWWQHLLIYSLFPKKSSGPLLRIMPSYFLNLKCASTYTNRFGQWDTPLMVSVSAFKRISSNLLLLAVKNITWSFCKLFPGWIEVSFGKAITIVSVTPHLMGIPCMAPISQKSYTRNRKVLAGYTWFCEPYSQSTERIEKGNMVLKKKKKLS